MNQGMLHSRYRIFTSTKNIEDCYNNEYIKKELYNIQKQYPMGILHNIQLTEILEEHFKHLTGN